MYNARMPTRRAEPRAYEAGRRLRRDMTPAERRLWARLREKQLQGVTFRRQHAIGRYVVDFCSPRHKLVIELDGSGHLKTAVQDTMRTQELQGMGYRVLRVWNHEVMTDIEAVAKTILAELNLTDTGPIS
jgi:very-short-patch-repair endonuclease